MVAVESESMYLKSLFVVEWILMSSRAIRSLRGDDALAIPKIKLPDAVVEDNGDEEEECDDDDDYQPLSQRQTQPRFNSQAFAALDDEDDDDDTTDEGSSTEQGETTINCDLL
jgi:hypothetical protein